MDMLWVPAAVITERLGHDAEVEAKAIQKEARERFKASNGIRVFSRPGRLQQWCDDNDVDLEKRRQLITDAGQLAPEFTLANDDAEFFVHSPFAVRQDENTVEDRNADALVMHVTFDVDGTQTKLFLASDVDHEVLADIVKVTEAKKNTPRLEADIHKLSHHCSYLSLGPDKGDNKTKPALKVQRLFEHYAQEGCIVVSTSDTIPSKGATKVVSSSWVIAAASASLATSRVALFF